MWFFFFVFSWCWYFCCFRRLAHDKIFDSWFSRGFLGFPCFTWEFLVFCWRKKNKLVNLVFLLEIQKTLVILGFCWKSTNSQVKSRKQRKPRENQESKNPRFSCRCLAHDKILDSWFSRGFLGFPCFTWEFLVFCWKSKKNPRNSWFFAGNPNKP